MRDETVKRSVLIPARSDDPTIGVTGGIALWAGLRTGWQFLGSKPGLSGGAWMVYAKKCDAYNSQGPFTHQEWTQGNRLTIWV